MSTVVALAPKHCWTIPVAVFFSLTSAAAFAQTAAESSPSDDVLIADFEQADYGDWHAEGEAFGSGPARGTLPNQMEVTGYEGQGLVNSYFRGDGPTGALTSPPFVIERRYLNFLIGGGGFAETRVDLIVDDKVVRTATGTNTLSGGSERLTPVHWDVADLVGQHATIQVVDHRTGGWGHVNFDHLVASGRPMGAPAEKLASPDFQTFPSYLDVDYGQSHRPQFHFTSRKNWLNDPNGLMYCDGEYHMFFQHNPLDVNWGNMTWGHAVSRDMVHWTQLPHALLPYGGGTIFSGTAAIDHNNTLGVQQGGTKTIVAAFTFAREPFGQAVAFSTDRGRTFTLWNDGAPVVVNQGYDVQERDPKIFWHEPSRTWVMVLWVKQGKPGRVLFFNSTDLTNWQIVSHFDRDWVFECMDLVELPVDGDGQNRKWLLYDASFDYEWGNFDGKTFSSEGTVRRGDYGPNFYAAQSFNNSPDGRTVMIGWMRGGDDAPFLRKRMPFNQQMSFPTTMELRTTAEGIQLFRWPIAEIESLYAESLELGPLSLAEAQEKVAGFKAELIDFSLEFQATAETSLLLRLRGQEFRYHNGELVIGQSRIPAQPENGKVAVRVLVDRTSVEVFANEGRAAAAEYAEIKPDVKSIELESDANVQILSLKIHALKSIWNE
jgi:sucrose-6-phosphate hydrolase SacC (GH32 family)